MNNPLVSIIVPVYNRESTIRYCLESILKLKYKNIELIIIDDGSSDSSSNICREITSNDCRIKYFQQTNKGVSAARNKGILEAEGTWITFVDSDDIVLPEHLDIIEKEADKDMDMLMTGFTWGNYQNGTIKIHHKTIPYKRIESPNAANYLFNSYNPFKNYVFPIWNKFFKSDILKCSKIHFDETISLGEDQVFLCNYLLHARKLIYYDIPSYISVIWPKLDCLGGKTRTPSDYLYNQKKNYEALCTMIPLGGEKAKHYSVNYAIDRPITKILYTYTKVNNLSLLKKGQLKDFTEKEIIPFLASIDISTGNATKFNVRFVRMLLLNYGAQVAINWCIFYNIVRFLALFPIKALRKLKYFIIK